MTVRRDDLVWEWVKRGGACMVRRCRFTSGAKTAAAWVERSLLDRIRCNMAHSGFVLITAQGSGGPRRRIDVGPLIDKPARFNKHGLLSNEGRTGTAGEEGSPPEVKCAQWNAKEGQAAHLRLN